MSRLSAFIEAVRHKRLLFHTNRLARRAVNGGISDWKRLERQGRQIRQAGTRLEQAAQRHAATKRPLPSTAEWAHRPEIWDGAQAQLPCPPVASGSTVFDSVTLHHDAAVSELSLNQHNATLSIDALSFNGSYVSLALPLPSSAKQQLTKEKVVGLSVHLESERAADAYARLNMRHGPNTEQLVRELPYENSTVRAEFDVFFAKIEPEEIDDIWLDLIFKNVAYNKISIHDLVIFQRARANV